MTSEIDDTPKPFKRMARSFVTRISQLISGLALVAIGIIALPLLCLGLFFGAMALNEIQHPPPPGYYSDFSPHGWDQQSIGDFLAVPLPADTTHLVVEGQKGSSSANYGFEPVLKFSFQSSPDTATAFAKTFCGGKLYAGFNPLRATNSKYPSKGAVVIFGLYSIYYMSSPGFSSEILGNRCVRDDARRNDWPARYLEDIVLDTSQPDHYTVSYRLGSSYSDDYPETLTVSPFEQQFPLLITGLQGDKSGQSPYVLISDFLCLEIGEPRSKLYLSAYGDEFLRQLNPYRDASLQFSIDNTPQPAAKVDRNRVIFDPPDDKTALFPYTGWNYCLNLKLATGTHKAVVTLTPKQGSPLILRWTFEVTKEADEATAPP